jgi:hypothetical protein
MDTERVKYSEAFYATLRRTVAIAVILGSILFGLYTLTAPAGNGRALNWFSWVVAVFWFSFGGHWVELFYLNWLRMKLPVNRAVETAVRLLVWYIGGCFLFAGMQYSSAALGNRCLLPFTWWFGGIFFIIAELAVHLILLLLKRRNFYSGEG